MIRAIAMKELRVLFASPLAWVILAFVQAIAAYFFLVLLKRYQLEQAQLAFTPGAGGFTERVAAPVFGTVGFVLLMVVPLLTMRLVAEERRSQTLPFLMSAPISITQIVLGKFLAVIAFLLLVCGLLVLMALSLYLGGKPDLGLVAANALGLLLLTGAFAAAGLWVSCLTSQPLVAVVGTYMLLLALWLVNIGSEDPTSFLHALSMIRHFDSFARGVLALADAAYYAICIALFLLLTIRRLDADRLRT
jgi:ABC-2 type transport system permease protein